MSGAPAARPAGDPAKGRVAATTVRRYWPGQAPDWVVEEEEEEGLVAAGAAAAAAAAAAGASTRPPSAAGPGAGSGRPPVEAPVVVSAPRPVDDPRLARLAQVQVRGRGKGEEGRGARRVFLAAHTPSARASLIPSLFLSRPFAGPGRGRPAPAGDRDRHHHRAEAGRR
jgi:hypothetical protein